MRYILPQILKKTVHNFHQVYSDENVKSGERMQKPEGEVTIEYIDGKTMHPKENSDDEYVDYEEIK